MMYKFQLIQSSHVYFVLEVLLIRNLDRTLDISVNSQKVEGHMSSEYLSRQLVFHTPLYCVFSFPHVCNVVQIQVCHCPIFVQYVCNIVQIQVCHCPIFVQYCMFTILSRQVCHCPIS